MRRRLLATLTTLSLLLCLATLLSWPLSLFRSDTLGRTGWRNEKANVWHAYGVNTRRHQVAFYYYLGNYRTEDPNIIGNEPQDMSPHFVHHFYGKRPALGRTHSLLGRLGFSYKHTRWRLAVSFDGYFLALPHWFLALFFSLLPLHRAHTLLKARRLRLLINHCQHCGYDLRATPLRSPECGSAARSYPPRGMRPHPRSRFRQ